LDIVSSLKSHQTDEYPGDKAPVDFDDRRSTTIGVSISMGGTQEAMGLVLLTTAAAISSTPSAVSPAGLEATDSRDKTNRARRMKLKSWRIGHE
jgi:hypothetical protein